MSRLRTKDGACGRRKIGWPDTAAILFSFRPAMNVRLGIVALILVGFGGCHGKREKVQEYSSDIGNIDVTVSEPEEIAVSGDAREGESATFGEVMGTETSEIMVRGDTPEKKCVLFGHPGDERNPEDDCWDPPEHYCSAGASSAITVACAPDVSVCCIFANTCVPCGWLTWDDGCSFCLVKDNEEGFEYRFCGDEDSPCKSYGPLIRSYEEGPDPRCPEIDWDLEICLEYR